jgi:hypothetical protein
MLNTIKREEKQFQKGFTFKLVATKKSLHHLIQTFVFLGIFFPVPRTGLEPAHLAAPPPQSGVSTNFTTWADIFYKGLQIYKPF